MRPTCSSTRYTHQSCLVCVKMQNSGLSGSVKCLQSIPSSKRKRCQDVTSQEEHQQALCSQRPYDSSQCKTSRQSRKVPLSGAHPSAQRLATEAGTYYSAVYSCLVQWCCRLKALQPKCIMTPEVLHRAMDLFHRYRSAAQFKDQTPPGLARSAVTPAHLAGCLWIAAKNDGNRSCVPSRTLLTKAIAVQPDDLTRAELEVCCRLRWNIFNSEVASAWQPLRSAYQ